MATKQEWKARALAFQSDAEEAHKRLAHIDAILEEVPYRITVPAEQASRVPAAGPARRAWILMWLYEQQKEREFALKQRNHELRKAVGLIKAMGDAGRSLDNILAGLDNLGTVDNVPAGTRQR